MSFASLAGLAQRHGHAGWIGYLLPVAVDVLAAAAAYALVVEPATSATESDHVATAPAAAAEPVPTPGQADSFGDATVDFELPLTWPDTASATAATTPAEPVEDPAAAFMAQAQQLVRDGVVRADPANVATALAALASGASQRAAASESGIHRTGISKLVAAATESSDAAETVSAA
ncbi:DUF2637 domain-containing protein [Tsukamurella paurometabola]|uniref:Protein of uncharacterized function (DUF2637) n=1 Tax=Tsukamurella paurometabola TaxID=2061 RepID=A0A3P8K0P4_TSUPA|nr:DUF2637 domain-containing protein [Tsukamurella paurometabola]UEA81618.1 DUF2637 domain-containing protein [Tsukamurella paurometabola]VDR38624.1 Protein of uncharacterised function (DUF2637) [Tsukamurella paurometabola]